MHFTLNTPNGASWWYGGTVAGQHMSQDQHPSLLVADRPQHNSLPQCGLIGCWLEAFADDLLDGLWHRLDTTRAMLPGAKRETMSPMKGAR